MDTTIYKALLETMGMDNGVIYTPCPKHEKELQAQVTLLKAEGLEFNQEEIDTITYGEQTEQEELLARYSGGMRLGGILNEIFDDCRKCTHVSRYSFR